MRRIVRALPFLLAGALVPASAAAAEDLSRYRLDVYNPLILNGSRCTGMGGAVVSLGDDADDMFYNAAASAVRNKFKTDPFEFDYTLYFANLFAPSDIDYRNSRALAPDLSSADNQYWALGVQVLYGRWALSFSINGDNSLFARATNQYSLQEQLIELTVAHEAVPGRLWLGLGFVTPKLQFKLGSAVLADYQYADRAFPSLRLGAIYAWPGLPLRLGASALFNFNGTVNAGTNVAGFQLPREVGHPFTLTVGGSWRQRLPGADALEARDKAWRAATNSGATPLVVTNEEGEKVAARPPKLYSLAPEYVLAALDLRFVGALADAVDILSYTGAGTAFRAGESAMLQPSLGFEVSFPEWLKVRAGWYWEGPRLSGAGGRGHLTANVELDALVVLGFDVAVTLTLDLAREYTSFGLSGKVWRY